MAALWPDSHAEIAEPDGGASHAISCREESTDMNATPEILPEENKDAAAASFEGEIREFVRKDLAPWRRARMPGSPSQDLPVDSVNQLIQRVSGQSVQEIEHVIAELQNVRDILRNEGERVQREIVGYANLSQAAMSSMKIIGDSMTQWKTSIGEPAARPERS
jgi:hypothetical protein